MRNTIGRPKSFDNDTVIDLAMQYFWEHGYDNSSLEDLLSAMSIKKSSFYANFKSKENLFSLALDLYRKNLFHIIRDTAKKYGVKKALFSLVDESLEDFKNTGTIKGCLLVNSANECYRKYTDLSSQINLEFKTFIEFLTQIIQKAKDKNEIKNHLDSKLIASRFLAYLTGLTLIMKAGADEKSISSVSDSINELLD
ncbi:MAG: hypothetical protein COB17_01840 [Sulfurimonas sp.]|nr:MAG: hypothetical protein COB17_01840 [Sulfurimonas sp.]